MKKIYILIIVLFALQSFSQKDYSRYYNSWRLGLNLGGAWQTADYRSCWGMAGGLTLEKGLHENSTNFFSFAIRGRYLAANTYGMDYNRNYDVKTNDAYNGKYDPAVNFADSVKAGRQYVYDNYKMTLGEGSLELQLTFNRLRERTHVLLNLWGGVGFTSYRTTSDLLDGNGKMYDFSLVDSTGNKTKALNSYNGLIDKKYESYAYGSRNGNLVTFSPSAGIGLGYQFSPGFSMLWEYKITLPFGTNADLLDGKLSMNNDAIAGSNDYYHYTGLNLVFTLRGKKKTRTTTPKDETVYTNTTTPSYNPPATNTTVPTNSIVPSTSVVTNPLPPATVTPLPPKEPKPVITFITPPSNAFVVNNQQYKISAQVLNVTASNKIQFKYNGASRTDFSYNAQTHIVEYNATLNSGSNSVQIIASNTSGIDNKLTSVVYQQPKAAVDPPLVSYINPVKPGSTVTVKTYTVRAQVLNVAAQNGISVYFNGMSTVFTYNASTKQISFVAELKEGSNTISITANNPVGEDTKLSDIIFNEKKPAGTAPVITMINPVTSPSTTATANYVFKAGVSNVTTKSQVVVKLNGTVVSNFAFSAPNVICPSVLIQGNNIFEVSATNNFGTDIKTAIVNYKPKEASVLPVVNLISPSTVNDATNSSLYNFKLSVLNVNAKADVEVLFNGVAQQGFNYDVTTKEMFFQSNLAVGDNTLSVKGINQFGSDSKQVNVKYTPIVTPKSPPVITIVNPLSSPSTISIVNYIFKASVTNITNKSQLVVKVNGTVVPNYAFSAPNVICPSILIAGNNVFEVTATNSDGSDTKTVIVNYRPKAVPIPPVVNLVMPSSALNTTNNNQYNFKLSVLNVNSKADVEVFFNGASQPGFSYDATTKEVFFQTVLAVGDNTLSVKGTNQFGSDSKQVNVKYSPPVETKLPPLVTISNPSGATSNVTVPNYIFKANVTNVPGTGGLEVKFNGNVVGNYSYDGMNVSFPALLVQGNNIFEVKATNNDGTDTKSAVVNYKVKALTMPPVISFMNPATLLATTQNPNYVFNASITNLPNTTGITVKYNGVAISNFSYDGSNLTYTATLAKGQNSLEVTASNKDGDDLKTAVVIFKPIVRLPALVILQPAATTPTVNNSSFNFVFKAFNVDQSQIEVTLNGSPVTAFSFVKPEGKFTGTLNAGENTLVIKATNSDGTATKTGKIVYVILPDTSTTTTGTTATEADGERRMTICHYPPGNNQNPQTLSVPYSAWPAHQAHGDTQGECPAKNDSIKVSPKPSENIKPNIAPRRPR